MFYQKKFWVTSFHQSTISRALNILSRKDQYKLFLAGVIQMFTGFLDLLAVGVIGALGALAVSGIESTKTGNRVNQLLSFFRIQDLTLQRQALVLGIAAALLFVLRTLVSMYFSRRVLYFLSKKSADITGKLVESLLSQPLSAIQGNSLQNTIYIVTNGVASVTMGILGSTLILIADTSLLIVVILGLAFIDPVTAVSTLIIFSLVGYLLYYYLQEKARSLGEQETRINVLSYEKLSEVLVSYREAVVRNRRGYYAKTITGLRRDLANILAELTFMPSISKYIIEAVLILGSFTVGAIQFALNDAKHAVATIVIFLAAGARVSPAVMRLQQTSIQIRRSFTPAKQALDMLDVYRNEELSIQDSSFSNEHGDFSPMVEVKEVSFRYPEKEHDVLSNISLTLSPGKVMGIVGSSGAGKTTLVDLILGVANPEAGLVLISGLPPLEAIRKWPGAIAYVPQDVGMINGTVKENIAIGFSKDAITDEQILESLRIIHLDDFILGLSEGIHTLVGERGSKLSGGQRQRLGIARALITKPRLLILDEATSSLDGLSELEISEAIKSLRGDTTIIIIAHRLSTVKDADVLIYIDKGKIAGTGNFDELKKLNKNFENQANIMNI